MCDRHVPAEPGVVFPQCSLTSDYELNDFRKLDVNPSGSPNLRRPNPPRRAERLRSTPDLATTAARVRERTGYPEPAVGKPR